MKRLSEQEVRELRRQGVKLKTEDGKSFIPRPAVKPSLPVAKETEPEPAQEDPFVKQTLTALITVMHANEANMQGLIKVGEVISGVVAELAKPKPKKNMELIVGRDTKGSINKIHVKEL